MIWLRNWDRLTVAVLCVAAVGCQWQWPDIPTRSSPSGSAAVDGEATRDPGEVDDELIAHIQNRRFAEAYALTTAASRDSVPLEVFASAVAKNRYLMTSKLIGCHRWVTYEGAVHLRECVMTSEVGKAYATLHYAMDGGEWRMTGIVIGGTPAFPGPSVAESSGSEQ